jgi:hypothetical protein
MNISINQLTEEGLIRGQPLKMDIIFIYGPLIKSAFVNLAKSIGLKKMGKKFRFFDIRIKR